MSEYQLLHKQPCECGGTNKNFALNFGTCTGCNGSGYNLLPVNADEWLLSRLEKLRWDEACEQWGEYVSATKGMDNPRFEGDER